ncbi:MAG: HAMP domain-containing histidine kinase [Actinomycetota bacterium]|nr:HAMP domain-containing histidine kinase [Actinomycetota bacterium]
MRRRALTIRSRLTLLYTATFTGGGAVLVGITYFLVAHSTRVNASAPTVDAATKFAAQCVKALKDPFPVANLNSKCEATARQGFTVGAQLQRDTTLNHLLTYSVLVLVAVTLLASVAGWLLAGRVLRPLAQITLAARAASEENLGHRVSLGGPRDELRLLADTFDDMLGRLDAAFTSQRRFIANAGHELRTPLTVMRTTLDVVLAKPAPKPRELVAMGQDVRRAVERAEALLEALVTLARNDRGLTVRETVDLATVAEDVLDRDVPDLQVHSSLSEAPVTGDPVLLERLVANLVDNAIGHNCPHGRVEVVTATRDGQVELRVRNTGEVIPDAVIEGLFEPFRRLEERTNSEGLGLGLAIVASIATLHGAEVTATANPAGGMTVSVTMRAAPAV